MTLQEKGLGYTAEDPVSLSDDTKKFQRTNFLG